MNIATNKALSEVNPVIDAEIDSATIDGASIDSAQDLIAAKAETVAIEQNDQLEQVELARQAEEVVEAQEAEPDKATSMSELMDNIVDSVGSFAAKYTGLAKAQEVIADSLGGIKEAAISVGVGVGLLSRNEEQVSTPSADVSAAPDAPQASIEPVRSVSGHFQDVAQDVGSSLPESAKAAVASIGAHLQQFSDEQGVSHTAQLETATQGLDAEAVARNQDAAQTV